MEKGSSSFHCYECKEELPKDGRMRKRNRPRKCKACNMQAAMKRRKEDPMRLLAHRLNNSMRRVYPDANDIDIWSLENVKHVFERFGGKSVISNEANPEYLCLFPYFKPTPDCPPTRETLVLVTSREAQSIAHSKTQEERNARFPQYIQDMMK